MSDRSFLQLAYEKKASSAELSLNVSYRKQNVREHILLTWLMNKTRAGAAFYQRVAYE